MAYTARDALKFAYVHLSQHGATRALWVSNFMYALNGAINHVYNYEWYVWSWQHVKDAFTLTWKKHLRLVTRWPIQVVDKFRTWERKDVMGTASPCDCPSIEDDSISCWCECFCPSECKDLPMVRIHPSNQLCPGEYKVNGSEIKGMWWLQWRIMEVYLPYDVTWLWVTYYRGPKHVTKRDDIIPVPDNFIHIIWYIIAAQCVPLYGIMMQQQDLNYWSIARKELDYLKKQDNIFPHKMIFNQDYPVTGEQLNSTAAGQWKWIMP